MGRRRSREQGGQVLSRGETATPSDSPAGKEPFPLEEEGNRPGAAACEPKGGDVQLESGSSGVRLPLDLI